MVKNNIGKLYGVGVGPGDPELITLKALRIIKECPVIGIPGRSIESSIAYSIVVKALADDSVLNNKHLLLIESPMTVDADSLSTAHQATATEIIKYLDSGKDVALLTLGDPTIYSTYIYIHRIIVAAGYQAQIISGVPSFCAAAATSGDSLVDQNQQLHIIPACYGIEDTSDLAGTRVYMKAGGRFDELRETFTNHTGYFIENCGMENEHIYTSADSLPDKGSYLSLGIIKNKEA